MATALMDCYRRTGCQEVFDVLVALSQGRLRRRVEARTRYLGGRADVDELLQDTFVNIYRYPDKFDGSRPGAFRAWSATIVDNAIRRHLRRRQAGPQISLRPIELLEQEADGRQREPYERVGDAEVCRRTARAYTLLLAAYLRAFEELSERERFVLQMVEVRGLRYAQVANLLGARAEALKMVVFRARRRVLARVAAMLPPVENTVARLAG